MQLFECAALIFDLDGVLVNSTAGIEIHWQAWAASHGLDVRRVLQVSHGRRTIETIRLVAPHLDVETEAARFETDEAVNHAAILRMDGAAELLLSLPEERWAVATSGALDTATNRLSGTGLPMPRVLVTADDVRRGKPDPQAYLLAAGRLGFPPAACIVVEDAPAGIQAGRAAGMRVIALATTCPPGELTGAQALVGRLADLHVSVDGAGLVVRLDPLVVDSGS